MQQTTIHANLKNQEQQKEWLEREQVIRRNLKAEMDAEWDALLKKREQKEAEEQTLMQQQTD